MFYYLFLNGIIAWIFGRFPLEVGGRGQMGKSTYAMGGGGS